MVDVVDRANAVREAVQIVDGGQYVVDRDGLADQSVAIFLEQLFLLVHVARLV